MGGELVGWPRWALLVSLRLVLLLLVGCHILNVLKFVFKFFKLVLKLCGFQVLLVLLSLDIWLLLIRLLLFGLLQLLGIFLKGPHGLCLFVMLLLKGSDLVLWVFDLLNDRLVVMLVVFFLLFVLSLLLEPLWLDLSFDFLLLFEQFVVLVELVVLGFHLRVLFNLLLLLLYSFCFGILLSLDLLSLLRFLIVYVLIYFVLDLLLCLIEVTIQLPSLIAQLVIEFAPDLRLLILKRCHVQLLPLVL